MSRDDINSDTRAVGLARLANSLEETYGSFINMDNTNSKGEPLRDVLITRCIAAHAVRMYGDELDPEMAADSVCDGSDDGGIDAVYVNSSSKKLILVQSKYIKDGNGSVTIKDFGRFKDACAKVIANDLSSFNERFLEHKEEITTAITSSSYKCICVFIYSGAHALSQEVIGEIDFWEKSQNKALLFRDMQSRDEYTILFETPNVSDISNSLRSQSTGAIDISNVILESYGEITEPYGAIYGTIAARIINDWWKKYKYALFEKNIRSVLGDSTSVNTGIISTIENTPENFWYYNNGITATYDEVEESIANAGASRKIGIFGFKKLNIINGAQTVSSIGAIFDSIPDDKKDKVRVMIRFINAKDPVFLGDVTKYNNTQNRVTGRDFTTQRPEQQKIQKEINFVGGYSYKLLRQEDSGVVASNVIDIDDSLNALVCKSKKPQLIATLKSNRGRFFDSTESALYEQVFNPKNPPSGISVINCVNLYRVCFDILKDTVLSTTNLTDEDSSKIPSLLTHGNYVFISILMSKIEPVTITNGIHIYDKTKVEIDTYKLARDIFEYIQINYPNSYLARFFQNREKVEQIITHFTESN
ncbi:MAG: AIPR family protein [Ewingella sp.]